jgi:poly(3-hydroxybutyrate) depolymerase
MQRKRLRMPGRWSGIAGTALAAASGFFALAQSDPGGARLAHFRSTIDATEQEYAIYLPHSYDPARKYPLLVGLHEEDSNHVAELKHVFAVPTRYGESSLQTLLTLPDLPDVDFVVACPFARGTMGYQGISEQDVYDMIAEVRRRYAIDEDRVYLTGGSMGGGAALWMALTRPDIWAAVAPVCAAVVPGSEELAGNALNLPVRLLHGDQDPAVPVASSRQWQKRFLDLGVTVDYGELPGVRHNAWDYAYTRRSLFEWFAARRRNPTPEHVRFSATSYRYNSAYWIRLDGLTPGTLASVDAVRSGTDVKVMTQNLDAFTISVAARTVTVDGAAMRLRAGAALTFVKTSGRWAQSAATASGKRPGLEGPIADAIRGRHVWVYGTAGAAAEEELARRKAVAETAAMWSTPRVRLNLRTVVKADRDVTEEEIAGANLMLFGTRESNLLIARLAGQLPLALSPGAADYGMVFIAPVGGR